MSERITAVVGFPRSGTSLMMRMLNVGGMDVVADNKASYEDSRTTNLPMSPDWLAVAKGKAIKILDPHFYRPPWRFTYDFIFMNRDFEQQAKSHLKLLKNMLGLPVQENEWPRLAGGLKRDTLIAHEKLRQYPNSRLIDVQFETLLSSPIAVAKDVDDFLGGSLNVRKMADEVMPRDAKNYPGFLELKYA